MKEVKLLSNGKRNAIIQVSTEFTDIVVRISYVEKGVRLFAERGIYFVSCPNDNTEISYLTDILLFCERKTQWILETAMRQIES